MIEISHVHIKQGNFELKDLNLKVESAQYAVLMGRTGTGKTTLIEAICGLRKIDSGSVMLNGQDVTHKKPALRGIGYVPQDGALFSTLSVEDT